MGTKEEAITIESTVFGKYFVLNSGDELQYIRDRVHACTRREYRARGTPAIGLLSRRGSFPRGQTERSPLSLALVMSRLMLCNLGNASTAGNDTNNNANTNSSMEDDDSYPLPTIYRCRAPIASLDCMEEFNGGGGGGGGVGADSGVHCSNTTGTKEQLLTSCIAAQAQRLQHPSPGIRYRNLGKSGLRVSNVGLGTWTTFGVGGCGSEETAEAVVALAYDSGINVFDLSEAHSGHRAEIQFGRILLRRAWNRSSYVVTTKIYWNTKDRSRYELRYKQGLGNVLGYVAMDIRGDYGSLHQLSAVQLCDADRRASGIPSVSQRET